MKLKRYKTRKAQDVLEYVLLVSIAVLGLLAAGFSMQKISEEGFFSDHIEAMQNKMGVGSRTY